VALGLYVAGIVSVVRRGGRWPVWPTFAFIVLGLGLYAAIEFGFLGTYARELRLAFTTRIALQLYAVPALFALGRPIDLARAALPPAGLRALDHFLKSIPMKVIGNNIFSPLFALALFATFLTPFAFFFRISPASEGAIGIVIPLIGMLMLLPLFDRSLLHSSFFITAEFMIAFVELIIDATPAIVLRLNSHVMDHGYAIATVTQSWFVSQHRDQQLSADMLWFIAEVADIPVLIYLFVRWTRTDKREATVMDELSDDEMEALTQEHLRSFRER